MDDDSNGRSLTDAQLLVGAGVVGVTGGLLALVYYLILQAGLHGIWVRLLHVAPLSLPVKPMWRPAVLVVTTLGGLLVGLFTRWLGSAGELAAVVDNIHLRHGRIDMRQTPSMVAVSLAGIVAGGSAGPEAPLVQIIGSCASRLADRLKLDGATVRTFTFCGMGAALGAFFGAPLGGALFALEVPHRRGIEYYEALLPALVSAFVAFLVFRSIVGIEPVLFHLPGASTPMSMSATLWGLAAGAVGAGVAGVFARIFYLVGKLLHPWEHHPVWLATAGGLAIGLLAQLCPKTLFWGELQIDGVLGSIGGLLLLTALVKMLTIAITLHSGFRGGFIFPLMFIGACVGAVISSWLPGAPAAVWIVGTMAAVNVAITKTPLSTCVILSTLSGTTLLPVLIAASLTSLILSTRLNLIRTQRGRTARAAVI